MQTLLRLSNLFTCSCGANMFDLSSTSSVIPMFKVNAIHLGCQDEVLLKVSRFVKCSDV